MCENCAAPDIASYISELRSNLSMAEANQRESENNQIREPYSLNVEKSKRLIAIKKQELNQATFSCKICLHKLVG